jgi:hypothetical protein
MNEILTDIVGVLAVLLLAAMTFLVGGLGWSLLQDELRDRRRG